MNHLGGHDALEYCRLRSIDSDWHRQMRQRNVLEQIQKACRKMSPLRLLKLADEVLPLVYTDLSREDVTKLADGSRCTGFCCACFDEIYPTPIPKGNSKNKFEQKIDKTKKKDKEKGDTNEELQ